MTDHAAGDPQDTGYGDVLADMTRVAREAGGLNLADFARFRDIEIEFKGPADFVSVADRESEMLIRERLGKAFPGFAFRGEEFPPEKGRASEYHWLVDPIDGTTNFVNGLDYTISIALREGRAR